MDVRYAGKPIVSDARDRLAALDFISFLDHGRLYMRDSHQGSIR